MATKKYLSPQYLDARERNFENIVFQAGKPLSSSELDLIQDIQGERRAHLKRHSGFIFSGSFWASGNAPEGFAFDLTPDTFSLEGAPLVQVGAWTFPLEYTASTDQGRNIIVLDPAPTQNTEWATDFVFLEVWRALIQPGDSTNKPATDKLYPWGNIKAPLAKALDEEYVGTPQTDSGRVQIQYAIRTVRLSDSDDRLGYTDSATTAMGPAQTPSSSFSFVRSEQDKGLWVAGDGDPDNELGTVDGYVYSIPICLVYRRNTQAFNYSNNGNGGRPLGSGASDRPDGLYGDQVVASDIQDMRIAVSGGVKDWSSLLSQTASSLLDNTLATWAQNGVDADWRVGGSNSENSIGSSRILMADDILPWGQAGGVGGNVIGNFDGLRYIFTDRTVRQVLKITYDHATWNGGGPLSLDLEATGIPGAGQAGPEVYITDVLHARIKDGNSVVDVPIEAVFFKNGGREVDVILDISGVTGTNEIEILFELELSPSGLSALVEEPASNFDFLVHNPSAFNGLIGGQTFSDDDAGRQAIAPYIHIVWEPGPNREARLVYQCEEDPLVITTYSFGDGRITLPYMPLDANSIAITGLGGPLGVEAVDGYDILISEQPPDGTEIEVEFIPVKPLPREAGVTLYYHTPALQAVPENYLPPELKLGLVATPPYLYSVTAASGSSSKSYPYEAPSNQIPNKGFRAERFLSGPGPISVNGFSADTGFLQLPTLIPLMEGVEITLKNPQTSSGNSYLHPVDYYEVISGTGDLATFAMPLSHAVEHKTFIPVLARLQEDTSFALEGSLVLVVFSQNHESEPENSVIMGPTAGKSCAAIYKIKGNPLL